MYHQTLLLILDQKCGSGFLKGIRTPRNIIIGSVADPHHFDADPDPTLHFDADPDPDPGSGSYCQLGMVKKKFSISVNNKTQMG